MPFRCGFVDAAFCFKALFSPNGSEQTAHLYKLVLYADVVTDSRNVRNDNILFSH